MHIAPRRLVLGFLSALGAMIVVAVVVARASADVALVSTTQDPTVTETVMLVGDSIPKSLADEFADVAAKRGYVVVSTATGGCPANAVNKVLSSGVRVAGSNCAKVAARQDAMIEEYRPALVVWWSRYELAPRLGANGKVLPLGSSAYFRAQQASFDKRVRALSRLGARLVTVQIEPPGPALAARNPAEKYFLVGQALLHRSDVVKGWNAFLARHKGPKVFSISIDRLVCRDARSPCDDRLPNGETARPDGIHYSDTAQRLLAPPIFEKIWSAAQIDTPLGS